MNINLREIADDESNALRLLYSDYISELLPINEAGLEHGLQLLDLYLTETDRHAYFIVDNQEICGFVLVNSYCVLEQRIPQYSIAEFYVRKEFRRKKAGSRAASIAFDLHRGYWEIRQMRSNKTGTLFWEKVIAKYTNHDFRNQSVSDERWDGMIQFFDNL